jgi:hypothetical protein
MIVIRKVLIALTRRRRGMTVSLIRMARRI